MVIQDIIILMQRKLKILDWFYCALLEKICSGEVNIQLKSMKVFNLISYMEYLK